jgi:hypothetical protein
VSLFAKLVPRGIRKLTWKKVGKALPVIAGVGALAIPGVGPAVAAGIGAAASKAGSIIKGGASVIGSVAKGAGTIASAGGSAAGEIANRVHETATDLAVNRSAVDDARRQLQDDVTSIDRSLSGPFPAQLPAFNSPQGLLAIGALVVIVILIARRR